MKAQSSNSAPPQHRASGEPARAKGKATRQRILEQSTRLFLDKHPGQVSVKEIAEAAGAYPNQVTYYFGSKEALLIHCGFFALLHDAKRIEPLGTRMKSAASFKEAIARTVLTFPSLPLAAKALTLAGANPTLDRLLTYYLNLTFRQSERYLETLLAKRGWTTQRSTNKESRIFWSSAFGATLISQTGFESRTGDLDLASTLSIVELSKTDESPAN